MSKWIKGLKKNKGPRLLPEIQKDYAQALARSGELQYQVFVFKKDLSKLNELILSLNHEAAERQKLDKENAPVTPEEK